MILRRTRRYNHRLGFNFIVTQHSSKGGSRAKSSCMQALTVLPAVAACRYDHLGSNFAVPLRSGKEEAGQAVVKTAERQKLPQALCDTWAWIRWDHAGRPHRSEEQADLEYEAAVAEMSGLLAAGRCVFVERRECVYIIVSSWLVAA